MELSQDGTASEAPTATAGLTIAERGVAEVSKNEGAEKVCQPNVVQAMDGWNGCSRRRHQIPERTLYVDQDV